MTAVQNSNENSGFNESIKRFIDHENKRRAEYEQEVAQQNKQNDPFGLQKVFTDLKNREDAWLKYSATLNCQKFNIPATEMSALIEADKIAEQFRQKIKGLTDISEIYFHCKQLESIFNQLPVWKYSFATGDGDFDKISSVYFMSASGSAIRIKYANLFDANRRASEKGMIIMEIQEKCFFAGAYVNQNSEFPVLDIATQEFSSLSFYQAIKNGSRTYQSVLKRYSDKNHSFITMDRDRTEKIGSHDGHEVVKIFWQR